MKDRSYKSQRTRMILMFIILELCFVFLIYRLFTLQYLQSDKLRLQAEIKHRKDIYLQARRGNIYDRKLHPLAINVKAYSLYTDPSVVERQESVAQSLASVLNVSSDEIRQRLENGKHFVWLKRQVSDNIVEKVKSMGFKNLNFAEEEKRFYPKGSLAAHVIGFVGFDNTGLEGIERNYDSYIKGIFKRSVSQMDRKGRDLNPYDVEYDDPTRGCDIVLTIDEMIQQIAETELKSACEKWSAKGGSVIVMNPKSGEILALANYPDYDLNQAFTVGDDPRRNRATMDLYEPGSAFKIVTAAAIINENSSIINERFDCENGVCNFDGFVIHDTGRYGQLTFSEVIEKSSNIGTVKMASRIGSKRLYDYIRAFGFDDKTGVELPETDGMIRPLKHWTKRSMAAVPFGQEISVNSLQMLCAANAIANDGVIMQPFIVNSVMSEQKPLMETLPREARNPVSAKTARIMRKILAGVVENGTGKNAQVDGYIVAGKTGTAQKASDRGTGYIPGKYVSSFTGFLPADKPLISMIVVIDEPRGEHLAGIVVCPVFREIAAQIMQYLTIGQGYCSLY